MPAHHAARATRLEEIRHLLSRHAVGSQEELLRLLRGRGARVTQSSVSRDLHQLRAAKQDGRYVLPATPRPGKEDALREAAAALLSVEAAGPHTLVLRTPAGHASVLAVALDAAAWAEVVGTVSGGDTVFVATRSRREQVRVLRRLATLTRPG